MKLYKLVTANCCCIIFLTRITHAQYQSLPTSSASSPYLIIKCSNGDGRRPWSNQHLLAWKFDTQTQHRSAQSEPCLLGRDTWLLAHMHLHDQGVIRDLSDQASLMPSIQSATEQRGWTIGPIQSRCNGFSNPATATHTMVTSIGSTTNPW